MFEGMFVTGMAFAGVYRYATAQDLEAAIAAVQELLVGEDDDFAPDLRLRRRELELRVRVDTECPRDWYLAYEALVETLAARAIDGAVTGEIDDILTSYPAALRDVDARAS